MKSERFLAHEKMILNVQATSEGRIDDRDVYALTHCLEHVSDQEREAWGDVIEDLRRVASAAVHYVDVISVPQRQNDSLRGAHQELIDAVERYRTTSAKP